MSVALRRKPDPAEVLEKMYMVIERRERYIACEEWNLIWDMYEVRLFERLWKEGQPLDVIAEKLGRDIDEVAILVMDRSKKGHIPIRTGGVYGGETEESHEPRIKPEQRKAALKLLDKGISAEDIATLIGVTSPSIYYIKRKAKKDKSAV